VDELCDDVYVPYGQLTHVLAACSLYVPAAHCLHAVGVVSGGNGYEYVPLGQKEHVDVVAHWNPQKLFGIHNLEATDKNAEGGGPVKSLS